MRSDNRQPRRLSTTLVREATDWGLTVSEKKMRSTWLNGALFGLAILAVFWGLIFVVPMIVGILVSAEFVSLGLQMGVVAVLTGVGVFFWFESRKGPRNALELDAAKSQLRIGVKNRYGKFVGRRVLPLKEVENVEVAADKDGNPELKIVASGEEVRVALADAKKERLTDISAQIRAAAETSRTAPRRSRIQSAIAGIGAGYRGITGRVASRVFD